MTQHESDPHAYWQTPSIQTHSGREFFPLDPQEDQVDPRDVAHALALKCRYTGHCDRFYSVAEHSVLMCDVMFYRNASLVDQRWALMHDASEAYLPDVAGPIKRYLPGFCNLEDRVLRVIGQRFDLPWPKNDIVTKLDRVMYWHERRFLMRDVSWVKGPPKGMEVHEEMNDFAPIQCWTPERAEQEFWIRFSRLFGHAARVSEINQTWARI